MEQIKQILKISLICVAKKHDIIQTMKKVKQNKFNKKHFTATQYNNLLYQKTN